MIHLVRGEPPDDYCLIGTIIGGGSCWLFSTANKQKTSVIVLSLVATDVSTARGAGSNANPQETGEDHSRPEAGTSVDQHTALTLVLLILGYVNKQGAANLQSTLAR